ncbi:MAG: NHL repeat-containing protein [Vulcanimicrobiaceae bacterium]
MQQTSQFRELIRLPSPAPAPQALACDGDHLWMGSWETQRIYGIDRQHFTVFEETNAPGKPVGAVSVGGELRVVCSEGGDDDHRFIRRYVPGHGFKAHDRIACPEDTGSFVAFNGTHLWLSQRFNQRILELDSAGRPLRRIETDTQILGIVWVGAVLYVSLWYGKQGGCKIALLSDPQDRLEHVVSMPFAAVSLTHDGSRFWTNDAKATAIVAFSVE